MFFGTGLSLALQSKHHNLIQVFVFGGYVYMGKGGAELLRHTTTIFGELELPQSNFGLFSYNNRHK